MDLYLSPFYQKIEASFTSPSRPEARPRPGLTGYLQYATKTRGMGKVYSSIPLLLYLLLIGIQKSLIVGKFYFLSFGHFSYGWRKMKGR